MASRNPLRRFWGFLLTAGEYEGEPRDQRGRRRIVVGIVWVSVVGLFGGIDWEGGPVGALDAIKAVNHLAALLVLWRWPRKITPIIFGMVGVDLVVDTALTVLHGGLYESGLQLMWSSIGVVALLVLTTVRAAAVFLVLFLATVVGVLAVPPISEPAIELSDPEAEAVFVLAVALLFTFLGMFYFVRQRDRFLHESESLLHNILPDEIATRLKVDEERLIADHFDDVTVLFVDVVDFTPMSEDLTPTELVGLLNAIFTDFDAMVDELELEKIKTVGDEYMVAAGIPTPRPDHAEAAAELALRIRERLRVQEYAGRRISVRMGLNSGPVVAGIIGRRKFSYDLWGDVVNTASRMEMHGVAGSIQISRSTYEHLQERYDCERRGTIEVKGKGPVETWFLRGRRSVAVAAGSE